MPVLKDSDFNRPIRTPYLGDPYYLLYRRIKLSTAPLKFEYSMRYKPLVKGTDTPSVAHFVRNVGTYEQQWKGDPAEYSILDIPVKRHSCIVIELDQTDGLTFRRDRAGISLGDLFEQNEVLANQLYTSVRYVDASYNIVNNPIDKCHMLLFDAVHIKKYQQVTAYNQPINFYVVDDGQTLLTIDPDIRYPGNGGGTEGGGGGAPLQQDGGIVL